MALKVTWKKGMRLTADIFNALDYSIDENIRMASLVATGGQFGLFTTENPFELSVNINNNIIEVISLSCHGITKSGKLVDIEFDSHYSNTFDTRVPLPANNNSDSLLLLVKLPDRKMREVNEMYSEVAYTFELVGENSPINKDSLPIGRLVNQYGWRLDETDFVPPCLFVSAHHRYVALFEKAKNVYRDIYNTCLNSHNCVARMLLASIWNTVSSEYISLDKLSVSVSPNWLFASVQKVVSSFVIGCNIDEFVSLENQDPFIAYIQTPYSDRNLYSDIDKGLQLCGEISVKIEAVCAMTEVREEPVEKPKPQPHPTPDPKPTGRNRRSVIEI